MTAIEEIAAERQRQIEKEGWSAEHDDREHARGDLADAAACYAATHSLFKAERRAGTAYATFTAYLPLWPWADRWWKPKDRRRDLIKAGALIVAEIERLDRVAAKKAAVAHIEIARNCSNWRDGECKTCGAQSQQFQVDADFRCPHFFAGTLDIQKQRDAALAAPAQS